MRKKYLKSAATTPEHWQDLPYFITSSGAFIAYFEYFGTLEIWKDSIFKYKVYIYNHTLGRFHTKGFGGFLEKNKLPSTAGKSGSSNSTPSLTQCFFIST